MVYCRRQSRLLISVIEQEVRGVEITMERKQQLHKNLGCVT